MPPESALQFLTKSRAGRPLPRVAVIYGTETFLREYILGVQVRAFTSEGFRRRSLQVGAGDDFSAVLNETASTDLFAPRKVIVCRVLKPRSERAEGAAPRASRRSRPERPETSFVRMVERLDGPIRMVLLYDRDNVPAGVSRAAEAGGVVVRCSRPFEDQLPRYARIFAGLAGVALSLQAAEYLVSRHGSGLAAIANTIAKASIFVAPGTTLEVKDLEEPGRGRIPGLFELAEAVARGKTGLAVAHLDHALALGRDPFELLAVEIVPAMRRMMVAAAMTQERKPVAEIAGALGLNPRSPLLRRALEGARRLGISRLESAYRRASELDAGFKNGTIKERRHALSGLLMDLLAPSSR